MFTSASRTGWLVGVLLGVCGSLLVLPPVRFMVLAQVRFALSNRALPFVNQFSGGPGDQEVSLFNRAAAAHPDDYLLQVGRATALAASGGLDRRSAHGSLAPQDNTLYRLGVVMRTFPDAPGAYAHQARYMMNDRIRIEPQTSAASANKSSPSTDPGEKLPDPDDLSMMEWALRSGEKRDGDNAFWPTMLAVTCFAAHRDIDGMDALSRAAHKLRWDAYIYEEVLGEWRLYSAVYGDYGAVQKIGPLSLVSFPHLGEIRQMAQLVRHIAESDVGKGNVAHAVKLRRELLTLGMIMRDRSQWAYEALIGTDVCIISGTDSNSPLVPARVRTSAQWKQNGAGYLSLLERTHRNFDIAFVSREIDTSCTLRNRIDMARFDRSYPGIPPGIPLADLFGNWMASVYIVQQILAFTLMTATMSLWQRASSFGFSVRATAQAGWIWLVSGVCISGFLMFAGVPSIGVAATFLCLLLLLIVGLVNRIQQAFGLERKSDTSEVGAPNDNARSKRIAAAVAIAAALPPIIVIFASRDYLSAQHPIAAALTSLVDVGHNMSIRETFMHALMACGVPLLAVFGLLVMSVFKRKMAVATSARVLVAMTPATIMVLGLAYVVLLNRTLMLDSEASRAISEAAKNDLQWVLTHSEPSSDAAP